MSTVQDSTSPDFSQSVRAEKLKIGPAFQFYPADFLTSTAEFSLAACGILIKALAHQWKLGSLPADRQKLARILGATQEEMLGFWGEISHLFKEEAGRLKNGRLEEVRADQAEYREMQSQKGKKGSDARWRKGKNQKKNGTGISAGNAPAIPSGNGPGYSPSSSPPSSSFSSTTTLGGEGVICDEKIQEYVVLATRHGAARDPVGLKKYLIKHGGLSEFHLSQLDSWRCEAPGNPDALRTLKYLDNLGKEEDPQSPWLDS